MSTPSPPIRFIPLSQTPLPSAWTLIVPAVTVGNIGQLAVDLLLTTATPQHLGRLSAPLVLPFASSAPATPPHLSAILTPVELYLLQTRGRAVVIAQQRAPVAAGRGAEHAKALVEWARGAGCVEVVVLGSAFAAGRRDVQLRGTGGLGERVRFAATGPALEGRLGERARELGWKVLEGLGGRGWVGEEERERMEGEREGGGGVAAFLPVMREGGFVREVLKVCEGVGVALTVLLMFVFEGDNERDACVMAGACAELVGVEVGEGEGEGEVEAEGVVEGIGAVRIGGDAAGEGERDPIARYMPLWKVPTDWHEAGAPPVGLY